jgi:hypothetical protein
MQAYFLRFAVLIAFGRNTAVAAAGMAMQTAMTSFVLFMRILFIE